MIESKILLKENLDTNENIILKTDKEGKIITLDCEDIVKSYLKKKSINYSNVNVKKTNEGLSNYIYYVIIDNHLKLFLKIFNNQIDRKFEEKIITLNAEQGNCAGILDTDCNYYRIEEFLENIKKLERKEIHTDRFFEILISKIINFNFLLSKENKNHNYQQEKDVFGVMQQTFINAQKSFKNFKCKFEDWKNINEFYITKDNKSESAPNCFYKLNNIEKPFDAFDLKNYEKIEFYLAEGKLTEIFDGIFPKDFLSKLRQGSDIGLTDIPLFLSHNDVHLHNFLFKPNFHNEGINKETNLNEENVLLIDYEYACFNVFGFDIVNFFIEGFFNLEFAEYPFYEKLEKSTKNIYDKIYYDKYLKFLNEFSKEFTIKGIEIDDISKLEFIDLFGTYEYYIKICKLASIYWFYTALQFLDFDCNVSKIGFNYVDYSIDRLSIYESFYN